MDEESGVSAAEVASAESAFYPFSAGARACVGKNLAHLEISIIMARASLSTRGQGNRCKHLRPACARLDVEQKEQESIRGDRYAHCG